MDTLTIWGAKYLIFIIGLAAIVLALLKYREKRWRFIGAIVAAGIISVVLAKLAGKLYYHPRPFVVENIKPLIAHANDNGFPSDHTTGSAVIATIVYLYNKKVGLIFFVLAVVVGLGRIGAHLHSPIDIIGGLLVGIFAGWAGVALIGKFLPAKSSERQRQTVPVTDKK